MPTLGVHFPDNEAGAVEIAAKASPEKKVGRYIAEAVRQRMERDGTLPADPTAELLGAANEIGLLRAVEVLKEEARKTKVA